MLGGGDFAGHLVTASLLSAPAGILIAKVLVPETEIPETIGSSNSPPPRSSANLIDAASMGALAGLRIAAYVGALLIAFVALVALLNAGFSAAGALFGAPDLTFQRALGLLLAPLAWLMGIPWEDAVHVGALLGVKTVLNEFLSAVVASYALCGFANFGSLAILLGAIGSMAPSRRADVASLGLRSILGGTLATLMTGCVAGLIL
jgi:CNT family concentrative nucleoside transporter